MEHLHGARLFVWISLWLQRDSEATEKQMNTPKAIPMIWVWMGPSAPE